MIVQSSKLKVILNIINFAFCIVILHFAICTLQLNEATAAMPSSTNYSLQEFSFGGGGTKESSSSNFNLNAILGEVEYGELSSTNFKTGTGLTFLQTASVPQAPSFSNPDNYYNKLQLILNVGTASSDTEFAIAISPDNFVTTTHYIQADMTLGNTPVWQTYSAWGSGTGITLIGLTSGTTYTAKVQARQGEFTQTGFGPTSQAATIIPSLSMTLSPTSVNIGQLTPGTVVTSASPVTATVTTNGTGGTLIYVYGTNNGLLSSTANYTISAVSNNLSGASEGYGLRTVSTSETSGGPMQKVAPYNGTGDTVGIVDTNKRPLFDSNNQPVTNGVGIFELKAKASSLTKAANDYTDIITVLASATF